MAAAATVAVFLLVIQLDALENARHLDAERGRTLDRLSTVRAHIESNLNARLHLVHGLAALIKSRKGTPDGEFPALARELLVDQSGIRSIQMAPGGVITHVFPFEANKVVLGFDLLRDPLRKEASQRAIQERHMVVAGPMPLPQGGVGVIARLPVFVNDDNGANEHFWGFGIVVVDFQSLLDESQVANGSSDLALALRGVDGLGAQGKVFFGDPALFEADPVKLDITLPGGSWQIAAMPGHGWTSHWPKRPRLLGLGAVVAALVGGLVGRVFSQGHSLRRAVAEARESETKFRAIFDRSFEFSGLMSPEGVLREVNQTALDAIGAQPADVLGKTFWDCPWWSHSAIQQTLVRINTAQAAAGQLARFEAIQPDGQRGLIYVDVSIKPLLDADGAVVMLMVEGYDVTQRKTAEDAVREREDLYHQMFQSSPAIKLVVDPDTGSITDANAAAIVYYGYRHDQILGMNISQVNVTPDDEAAAEARRAEAERRHYLRQHHRLANGDIRDVEVFSGPVRHGDKALLHAIIHDITDRNKLEKALAESNAELEQFAYVASHDLREPLRMVTSYLQLIDRRMGDRLGDEGHEFLTFAVDGARRMDHLIVDLLEFSRVGRHNRPFAAVSLAQAIGAALHNLGPIIEDSGSTIHLPDAPLPTVWGDEGELIRLFQNLIGNGIKYHLPDRPPVISIAAERQGEEWWITVADNGIGIDPAYFDRIFQLFQRLHRRDEYEGTGIGLPLVKKIVEHHGGRVWVNSTPGTGSLFGVALPISSP
jgi:PAS domain S-box-containing protein